MNCIKSLPAVILLTAPLPAVHIQPQLPESLDHPSRHQALAPVALVLADNNKPPTSKRSPQQISDEEVRMRMMLLQRSQGFGGIFAPLMQGLKQGGGGGKGSAKDCGPYTDYAACQAYKAGDGWAADRLQNRKSTPAERDWYDR